jgi:hypothetical protein
MSSIKSLALAAAAFAILAAAVGAAPAFAHTHPFDAVTTSNVSGGSNAPETIARGLQSHGTDTTVAAALPAYKLGNTGPVPADRDGMRLY